jgi:hypothetical protein
LELAAVSPFIDTFNSSQRMLNPFVYLEKALKSDLFLFCKYSFLNITKYVPAKMMDSSLRFHCNISVGNLTQNTEIITLELALQTYPNSSYIDVSKNNKLYVFIKDKFGTSLAPSLTTKVFGTEFKLNFTNYKSNYDTVDINLVSDQQYGNLPTPLTCNTSTSVISCNFPKVSWNHIKINIIFNVTFYSSFFNASVSIQSRVILFTGIYSFH